MRGSSESADRAEWPAADRGDAVRDADLYVRALSGSVFNADAGRSRLTTHGEFGRGGGAGAVRMGNSTDFGN